MLDPGRTCSSRRRTPPRHSRGAIAIGDDERLSAMRSGSACHDRAEPARCGEACARARIDEQTKTEAASVLKAMGLTVSDAFRLSRRCGRRGAANWSPSARRKICSRCYHPSYLTR
jgi:hypothetical protein